MQVNKTQEAKIRSAYAECLRLARTHYEIFPTASRLVEKSHRQATAAIYSFARRADDIADEGDKTALQRHSELDGFSDKLVDIIEDHPIDDPTFIALKDTIKRYDLPLSPFERLLIAFKMDIDKKRFADFDELLFYCSHSANPVGELILRLHGRYNTTTQPLSDSICTALQLINFLQDIYDDFQSRDRVYLPQDEMTAFAINESVLKNTTNSSDLHGLIDQQLNRALSMLIAGVPLIDHLHGQLKWVIKLTISSALLVCEKLSTRTNVFTRPTLSRMDWLKIALRSIYFRPSRTHAKILSNLNHRTPHG